jgi:hypothetical protein
VLALIGLTDQSLFSADLASGITEILRVHGTSLGCWQLQEGPVSITSPNDETSHYKRGLGLLATQGCGRDHHFQTSGGDVVYQSGHQKVASVDVVQDRLYIDVYRSDRV